MKKLQSVALVALSLAISPVLAQAENIAIVVGIGHYPKLKNADLPDVKNDVDLMAKALHKAGFQRIIHLLDGAASKKQIQSAFQKAKKALKPGDKFCYYHSGHGSNDHRLLTWDTSSAGDFTISTNELKIWMDSLNTAHKTAVLDAAFAGGFANESYAFVGSSASDEVSMILTFNGKKESALTHYFANAVLENPAGNWDVIAKATVDAVQKVTDGKQTPVFKMSEMNAPIFTHKPPK